MGHRSRHLHFAAVQRFATSQKVLTQIIRAARGKALLLFAAVLACLGHCPLAGAQTGEWTWMGGSSVFTNLHAFEIGPPGIYGTLGKPSATNTPGGRLGAASWTDKNDNFWLFGGGGLDSVDTFGVLNDLWEFDTSTREWTWVAGSDTIPITNGGQPGVYGKSGTPASANIPGSRSGALTWTDPSGNLWLFGGAGYDANGVSGNLNDLWEFNPSTREWTWMGGNSVLDSSTRVAGVYGTLGSLTLGSYPGSRNYGTAWTDVSGNLWLFGGYGADALNQYGALNDLWKFVPSTGQWAWMGGSSTIPGDSEGQPGVYGTLGMAAAGNVPGGREGAAGWVDKSGNLWLFGGNGFVTVGSTFTNGFLNDLWEFNPSTQEWAWMGGSNTLPQNCASGPCDGWPGVYGTKGVPSTANMPGSHSPAAAWTDPDGSFWLFGGVGYAANGNVGYLNDLWKFDPVTQEWVWVDGSSTVSSSGVVPGVYGTSGSPDAANTPGGRQSAVGWTDSKGHLWLMGGDGSDEDGTTGYLNDVWELQLAAAAPAFSLAAGTYTSTQTVTLSDATPGALIYYTTDCGAPLE